MSFATQFVASYLIVDALCLVLALIIIATVSHDLGTQTQNRWFRLVLAAYMVFVTFDAVWALIAYSGHFSPSSLMLSVVNGINLSALACAGYFWIRFSLAYLGSDDTDSEALRISPAIPALLVPVLHAIGYALNQNVIVHPDGNMTYGWMHMVVVFIQLSYVVWATCISAREYRRARLRAKRRMCLVFMSFMLPFVAAGVVDLLIPNTPIAAAGIVASFTFIMMSMQESRISSDALTGLNNRRRADAFLDESVAHASPSHPLHLFLLDLDRFKSINDTYGHLEGDRALRLAADALRLVCGRTNAFAARWGGDEFVIICRRLNKDPQLVSDLIVDTLATKAAEAELPYPLTCSVGHASCTSPSEGCDKLIAQADEALYRTKRMKGTIQER